MCSPCSKLRIAVKSTETFCPQRDLILGPLAPQASVLPLDHCGCMKVKFSKSSSLNSIWKSEKRWNHVPLYPEYLKCKRSNFCPYGLRITPRSTIYLITIFEAMNATVVCLGHYESPPPRWYLFVVEMQIWRPGWWLNPTVSFAWTV